MPLGRDYGIGANRVADAHVVSVVQSGERGAPAPRDVSSDRREPVGLELNKRLPETKCLLLAIFPRGKDADDPLRKINEATNQIIKGFADGERVFFLNINDTFLEEDGTLSKSIMPDLLHPNEKGYRLWAEAMEHEIEKLMKSS